MPHRPQGGRRSALLGRAGRIVQSCRPSMQAAGVIPAGFLPRSARHRLAVVSVLAGIRHVAVFVVIGRVSPSLSGSSGSIMAASSAVGSVRWSAVLAGRSAIVDSGPGLLYRCRKRFDDAAVFHRRLIATGQALQLRLEPLQVGDALAHLDQVGLNQAIDIATGVPRLIGQFDQRANFIKGEAQLRPRLMNRNRATSEPCSCDSRTTSATAPRAGRCARSSGWSPRSQPWPG